jgi:Uma2 family endonuclease
MVAKRDEWMSVEDFLALDREKLDQKYEFRNGQMVAMAGGSTNHTMLISNMQALIHPHVRKKGCFALAEGTLKVEDECYIPDIMVTCNKQDLTENKTYVEHPTLVVEVLSTSTETDDRRDKVLAYTRCSSIQEYILVNWDCMLIQKMTRKGTQGLDSIQWIDHWYGKGESVELESIGLSIPVDEIYADIVFPDVDLLRGFRKRRRKRTEA